MNEVKPIRFAFARISTDEFAILGDDYDPMQQVLMNTTMAFGFNPKEKSFGVQFKCIALIQDRPKVVLAVTCHYRIAPEDWKSVYVEKINTLTIPRMTALHLASLTISTARGVLHVKTERHPINAVIIPPIDVNDFVKSDLLLNAAEMTPERVPPPVVSGPAITEPK